MKLTEQEVRTPLKAAQQVGTLAAIICSLAPVVYVFVLYIMRARVVEAARAIARYTFGKDIFTMSMGTDK